jgi:hypothetical protein
MSKIHVGKVVREKEPCNDRREIPTLVELHHGNFVRSHPMCTFGRITDLELVLNAKLHV